MQRKIAVVGSWRSVEREKSQESRERFFDLSQIIGAALHDMGYILRVAWSNDHLLHQCRPARNGREFVSNNLDGTFSADPADCRFLFHDTADYHAMVGYLKAAMQRPRADAGIELEISKQMYDGLTEEMMVAWPPVADREIIPGYPLRDHVAGGLLSLTHIPGCLEPEYLRSEQLSELIVGNNAVDVVLGLGGGKASKTMFNTALEKGKLIPLPYCGGAAEQALMRCYAKHSGFIYERLSYVFGKQISDPEQFQKKDREDIVKELEAIERFFSNPYRVFVAYPFGYSKEERDRQWSLFKRIRRAIQRIVEENHTDLYPGADAFRLDENLVESKEIHQEMFAQIEKSGVIFCELTPLDPNDLAPNANVYFEMGYARGVSDGKRLLLFARDGTRLPFDVSNLHIKSWADENDFEELCYKTIGELYEKIRLGVR